MGLDLFVRNFVRGIVAKASNVLTRTRDLCDPQMELLLLRCCTGAPKLIHWLRTCVPAVIIDQIVAFDISLQHILGTPVYGKDRLALHLPLSMGGIGIPIVSVVADSAFVSSVGAS